MTNWDSRPQRAVVAAFLSDRGEVLLARRALTKTIAPGKYHLPGGHVEFGEHPADALARELREELAAPVRVTEPIWVFHYVLGADHTVGIVYWVELDGGREQLHWSADDFEDCVWATEQQLDRYLARDDHNYQAAVAGFARARRTPRAT